jgi:hypothetical protein
VRSHSAQLREHTKRISNINQSGYYPVVNLKNTSTNATSYTQIGFEGTGRSWSVGVGNTDETTFGVANKFIIYDVTGNAIRFSIDGSGNTVMGTVTTGVWNGSSISTTYTDAKIKTVTGTSNRLTIGGTSTDPTFDISTSFVGQSAITTLGTITTGTWNATVIGIAYGGTGVSLSDPAANKLLGWDDTDNTNGYWTIGTGLSYDHATHTLSSTGGGGSGETNTASNFGGGLANYSTKVGVDLQFNSFAAADFNLASNVISIDYVNGQMATASVNGFMSTTNQTFAGDKTFENIFIADGKGEVIGNSSKLTVGVASEFQVQGTATADASMLLASFNTTAANDANFNFYRSKDAALGTATVVASGDELGSINWYGAQQTGTFSNAVIGARIYAKVSAAVTSGASGDMPTDVIISTTANASGTVTDRVKFTATSIEPTTDGAIGLGNTSGNTFSGVWLAGASEVNFGGGDVRFIQSTNSMLFTGAANGYKFDATIIPNANDGSALGTSTVSWSDLFLASGAVVNFNNGDVTVTHSTDVSLSQVQPVDINSMLPFFLAQAMALLSVLQL